MLQKESYSPKNVVPLSPHMKMADLIHANYKNITVLSRFEISLGFGDKTVEEVCNKYSVNVSLLLLICTIMFDNEMDLTEEQISHYSVVQIVSYLQKSHQYYLLVALPEIQQLLNRLVAVCSESHGKALTRFFYEYRQEVEKHLANEDGKVFPYILQLLRDLSVQRFSIRYYKDHHANIETKLTDLKNIIIKYIPYNNTDILRDELLIRLFDFEDDLNRHTLIEDKLLIPSVISLERQMLEL
jgi:regulator of cell morphogenesis and NO signaling